MKNFEYFKPDNIGEACSLLSKYTAEAKIIAGGQSLLIMMKERMITPSYLIDITNIPGLDHIQYDDREGLRVGASTTHRAIETSPLIKERFNILSEVEKVIGSIQIRNVGTIGGNLCHADPCGDLAPLLIALDAKVKLAGTEGERVIPLDGFFVDYFETALREDEILTEIQIPPPLPYSGKWYQKLSPRETDSAVVGVAVVVSLDSPNGVCQKARIVLGGAGQIPFRAEKAEMGLKDVSVTEKLIEEAARIAGKEANPISDLRGSAEYKRAMIELLTKEGIERACESAREWQKNGRR
ncbi:MAG: xanthine dehydrogenase family protein subunit M [Thermodesulfobacteriota bacterium]|nr:xanthine dehydrogenase family protein subunit M [Thermodesulfobacteriota bacterium]